MQISDEEGKQLDLRIFKTTRGFSEDGLLKCLTRGEEISKHEIYGMDLGDLLDLLVSLTLVFSGACGLPTANHVENIRPLLSEEDVKRFKALDKSIETVSTVIREKFTRRP